MINHKPLQEAIISEMDASRRLRTRFVIWHDVVWGLFVPDPTDGEKYETIVNGETATLYFDEAIRSWVPYDEESENLLLEAIRQMKGSS